MLLCILHFMDHWDIFLQEEKLNFKNILLDTSKSVLLSLLF